MQLAAKDGAIPRRVLLSVGNSPPPLHSGDMLMDDVLFL
jgi:hypothetical protein